MKKKFFALVLAVLLPLGLLAGSGDVNGDGKVNVADIVEIINYLKGNPSECFNAKAADANNDGTVNEADLETMAEKIMSLGHSPFLQAEKKNIEVMMAGDPDYGSHFIKVRLKTNLLYSILIETSEEWLYHTECDDSTFPIVTHTFC